MGTVRYTVIDHEIIAEDTAGVRRLYVPDPSGSTVALLDNTQTPTDTFSYWPYGEVNARTGTIPTPFQFAGSQGYHRDSTTLSYVRARTLNTGTARWLTVDPMELDFGALSLYRYASNAPVSFVDPSGERPWISDNCGWRNAIRIRRALRNACRNHIWRIPYGDLRSCLYRRCRGARITCFTDCLVTDYGDTAGGQGGLLSNL